MYHSGGGVDRRVRGNRGNLHTSAQLCCEPKLTLKNKALRKKKKATELDLTKLCLN